MFDITILYGETTDTLSHELEESFESFGLTVECLSIKQFVADGTQTDSPKRCSSNLWVVCWDKSIQSNATAIEILSGAYRRPRAGEYSNLLNQPIVCTLDLVPKERMAQNPVELTDWFFAETREGAVSALRGLYKAIDTALDLGRLLIEYYDALTRAEAAERLAKLLALQREREKQNTQEDMPNIYSRVLENLNSAARSLVETDTPLVHRHNVKQLFQFLRKASENADIPQDIQSISIDGLSESDIRQSAVTLGTSLTHLASNNLGLLAPQLISIVYDDKQDNPSTEIGGVVHEYLRKHNDVYRSLFLSQDKNIQSSSVAALLKDEIGKENGLRAECRTFKPTDYDELENRLFSPKATAAVDEPHWLFEASEHRRKKIQRRREIRRIYRSWRSRIASNFVDWSLGKAWSVLLAIFVGVGIFLAAFVGEEPKPAALIQEISPATSEENSVPEPEFLIPVQATSDTIFSGSNGEINSIEVAPDGLSFVTTSDDRVVRVWRLDSSSSLTEIRSNGKYISSASFFENGKWIVTSTTDGDIEIWDALTGSRLSGPYNAYSQSQIEQFRRRNEGTHRVYDVAPLLNPTRLAVGNWDGYIRLIKVESITSDTAADEKNNSLLKMTYIGEETVDLQLASADSSLNGQAAFCDLSGSITYSQDGFTSDTSDELHFDLRDESERCEFVKLSNNGEYLLVGWEDGMLQILDLANDLSSVDLIDPVSDIKDASISDDGLWLVIVDEGDRNGGELTFFKREQDRSYSKIFSRRPYSRQSPAHSRRVNESGYACCKLNSIQILPGLGKSGLPQILTGADDNQIVLWNLEMSPIEQHENTFPEAAESFDAKNN